jgi:hypothetical protein
MFADSIRGLLLEDGRHQVHLVEMPDASLAGVMIVDSILFNNVPSLANQQKRLVVMAHKERDDLAKIWDAGVRHVLFYGDSPLKVRVAVLGMELSLAASVASAS